MNSRLRDGSPGDNANGDKIDGIESFDINQEGLASHGTSLHKLERILVNGLNVKDEVDFNIIGSMSLDPATKEIHRTGFGRDEQIYGMPQMEHPAACNLYLVTDIFKKHWPNYILSIIRDEPVIGMGNRGSGCFEQFALSRTFEVYDILDWTRENISSTCLQPPNPEDIVFPFAAEKICGSRYRPDFSRHQSGSYTEMQKALNHRAFNAIVIPGRSYYKEDQDSPGGDLDQNAILARVIAIQKKILPRNKHVPCYDLDGRCIYNPLV